MRGEHSRIRFDRGERLTGVHLVMGAQVTDADQVESQAIGRELQRQEGQLAIRSGVPRDVGCLVFGAEVTTTGWTRPAIEALRPGFVVARGRVAEVRAAEGWAPGDDLMAAQVDFEGLAPDLSPDAVLYADVWDRVETPAVRPALTDTAFLGAVSSNRTVRVAQVKAAPWTDADQDDATVRTTFADETGAQALPRFGDLRLTEVSFAQLPDADDPCDPCATEFADDPVDVGNHLFRFEVHESDWGFASLSTGGAVVAPAGDAIIVKWSRDNGGLEAAIGSAMADDLASDPRFAAAVFEITSVAGDQRQGLRQPGDARRASLVDRAGLEAAIVARVDGAVARVWDGAALLRFVGGGTVTVETVGTSQAEAEIDGNELIVVAGNLRLRFAGLDSGAPAGFVLPGDAWVVEIREFASPVPVPPAVDPDPRLAFRSEPIGIEHDYVYLGLVQNGAFRFDDTTDVRDRAFPPLTDIEAREVEFDPSNVGSTTHNVQEAIEDLWLNHAEGCGEIVIPSGLGLAAFVQRLRDDGVLSQGADLKICLGARDFELAERIEFADLGHITVTGIGAGSRITTTAAQGVLAFTRCAAVTLRDFAFDMDHTGGRALDLTRCGEVEIAHVSVRDRRPDALSPPHGAAAIRVWQGDGQRAPATRVTVADCRIAVRAGGDALRIIDPGHAIVRANHISTIVRRFRLDDWLASNDFAAALGRVFIDNLTFPGAGPQGLRLRGGEPIATGTTRRNRVTASGGLLGALRVEFTSDRMLPAGFFERVLRENRTDAANRDATAVFVRRTRRELARSLTGASALTISADDSALLRGPIRAFVLRTTPFVPGGSGVRIAFTRPPTIRERDPPILNVLTELGGQSCEVTGNVVDGFARPIGVGASNSGGVVGDPAADAGAFFVCRSAVVRDNVCGIAPIPAARQRHGIFVGHAMAVTVTGNRVENRSASGMTAAGVPQGPPDFSEVPDSDGIRLWGRYGALVDVTGNLVYGTRVGVQFQSLGPPVGETPNVTEMWRLQPNAFVGPGPALRTGSG